MTEKVPPVEHTSQPAKPRLERIEAQFLLSAPNLRKCPEDDVKEVAFAGRSNAGKSSVLNQVTGNRRMAKVSKTPGRTQLLNLFELRTGGRVVDLPGYGYAKAGKAAQATWQQSVNEYLSFRDNLVGLVVVMDIRHPNQGFDQELLGWAIESNLACHVLLNKADKLSYSKQQQAQAKFRKTYDHAENLSVQTFSATKGTGKADFIALLLEWLS